MSACQRSRMMFRACAAVSITCLIAAPAYAQAPSAPLTLACHGPKIESLRFPFSGRAVGSADTSAAFEVALDFNAGVAWINGRPARKSTFTPTEVAISPRRGSAVIHIDRFTGVWAAAGGTGMCTPVKMGTRAF